MSAEKRKDWFGTEHSEEEDSGRGYDSESEAERKGGRGAGRSSKRRKVEPSSAVRAGRDDSLEEGSEDERGPEDPVDAGTRRADHEGPHDALPTASSSTKRTTSADHVKLKPLTARELAASRDAITKTGVVYLSRVPPFMKATKLRSLLSPFGAINRIFLTPEDPSSHTARVRSGGNKKRSFTDGWVEFRNKADAKIVAETLNTRIIGGRKGSFYHDDVWNIRYLRGFKWHHLTEQIANENAARASRLRSEIAASRKEDREYVRNVERAKMMDGMQRKAAARRAREAPGPEEPEEGQGEKMERPERRERTDLLPQKKGYPRHFRQNQVKSKGQDLVSSQASESVQRVLSKIF